MLKPVHTAAARTPTYGRWARPLAVVCCAGIFPLSQAACQKQSIKVKGHDLATILAADRKRVKGIPVDLEGALAAARSYFQTRGMITLVINSDQISTSSPLELVNATTGFSLIKAPAGAFGLAGDENIDESNSWSLNSSGYDFQLRIYPLDPSFAGKFSYGPNHLVLNVDQPTAPKDAKQDVTLQDFPFFSQAGSAFASNDQQLENFQGEVVTVSGPFVNNGAYELSNGFTGVLSR